MRGSDSLKEDIRVSLLSLPGCFPAIGGNAPQESNGKQYPSSLYLIKNTNMYRIVLHIVPYLALQHGRGAEMCRHVCGLTTLK